MPDEEETETDMVLLAFLYQVRLHVAPDTSRHEN